MTTFKIWDTCRLLAVLLVLYLLHPETVQSKMPTAREETAVTALRCIFWSDPVQPCVEPTGYVLPNRLLQMYETMNEEMKESIRTGRLETMTPEDFSKLTTSFFLLISSHHLNRISGSSLAALLISSQDVAVAVKIMENINIGMFEDFFMKLQGVELKSQIQDVIAKTLVKLLPDVNNSWNYHRFRTIEKVGDPLLAHLPSYFLANLTKSESSKFLFHLRNWLWSNLPTNLWHGKTEASKRAWTDLMLRSSYPYNLSEWNANEVRRFRYFLEGATPDELQQLTAQQLQNTVLFKTKLNRLQVQAIFNILYSNRELSSANLTGAQLLPVALQLSPANLLRFNVSSTDFRVLTSLFEQTKVCSYTTAKQILESLIAQSVLSGRLKSVEPETWGNGIEHLGKFIYVLPVSALESYRLSPPTALVQSNIDSDRITARQARLLTGGSVIDLEKPDLIMGQKGLLRALSSSQLVSARTLPQNLLYHLLVSLPSDMPMQAAALLQKVEKLIGDRWTLEKILSNKDPNQFFEMLPSRTIAAIVTDIESMRGFDKVIKGLPPNTLSVLLTATRTKLTYHSGMWTSDTLLSGGPNLALLGLTCNDIYAMETVDFIYIMEQYNRVSKALNKPFPKDLQYCSQMALMNYLEMKASLQDFKHSQQLLDYLEPPEIEAIGGYILANLPAQDIEKAINSQHILETIGQLSLPELIVATKEIKPYRYAQLLLKKHAHPCRQVTEIKAFELSSLGNLVHFLPAIDILKINPVSMKLFIESFGDLTSKVICADSVTRSAWYQIILKAFGDPFSWTSSELAILGDFLLVVPNDVLNSVPLDNWKNVADTLVEQTSYHMKVEWPGMVGRIQLYQACAEILDSESSNYVAAVRRLARWLLAAVQTQLNTVVNASQLLATVHQSKKEKPERKMVIPSFPMEIQHLDTVVKVLVPDEVEKSIIVKKPGAEMELGTVIVPNAVTSASTTLPTSTVALHESDQTLNVDIIEEYEEMDTSTTADDEVDRQSPMQVSTPVAEISSWSSIISHEINTIDEDGDYLTTLKGSTIISTESSLENATVTVIYPSTSTAVVSNSTSVPSDIHSSERSAELSTDLQIKFAENFKNKNILQEIKLESSADSLQVNGDISLKTNEKISLFLNRSEYKNVKVKRHATVEEKEEQKNSQTTNGSNRAEQSGEVLRGVIRTNTFTSHTRPPAGSPLTPEIEMTSVQPTDRREIPRYWEKVSCDAIRATGLSAGLALDETDIELMGLEELEICVHTLGSLELDNKVQRKIWSLVNKDKLLENLSDLGHLVKVLDVDDVSKINLNLSSSNAMDNLATLSEMVTDTHVLHEVGSHFLKSNPDMKKLITETTVALGRILCEVLAISSQKPHDLLEHSVFLQASPKLGRMKDCPTHCLHKFVNLATRTSEYGPLDMWTAEDVATLGTIPAGLKAEQWRKLSSAGYGNNPLVGLRPSAIRCIPPQIFKELNDDQLKSLPTLSAAVVSEEQLSHLSGSQQLALTRVQKEVPILKYSEDTDSSMKQNHKPNGSASSMDINLLVIIVLAVISRFTA